MTPAEQIAHHIERLRPAPAAPAPATTPERARIVAAAERVAQALAADPTLNHHRRARPVDLFAETLRQVHPIARQADLYAAHQALAQRTDPEAERERNQLGKTNPTAPAELAQLAERAEHHAAAVEAAARPDWHTPAASRQLSAEMLPDPQALAAIADQLRRAVADARALPYPCAEAERLAALADAIEDRRQTCRETPARAPLRRARMRGHVHPGRHRPTAPVLLSRLRHPGPPRGRPPQPGRLRGPRAARPRR